MHFRKIFIYLIAHALLLIPSYGMEKKEINNSDLGMNQGQVSSARTEIMSCEQEVPVFYKPSEFTLFISQLIDVEITDEDPAYGKEEQAQDRARIESAIQTIESIPSQNDVEHIIFQDSLLTTEHYLQRLLAVCFNGEAKRFKLLKTITFDNVVFSDAAWKIVYPVEEKFVSGIMNALKRHTVKYKDCTTLKPKNDQSDEASISQASLKKAGDVRKQILAKYSQYLPSQPKSTQRDGLQRDFSKLWASRPKELLLSPRRESASQEDSLQTKSDGDESKETLDRVQAVKQFILAQYAQGLPSSSPTHPSLPTRSKSMLRAHSELRRATSQQHEPSSVASTIQDEDDSSSVSGES